MLQFKMIFARLFDGKIAEIFRIEWSEAIDPDLDMLEVFHAASLRSTGPVWSQSTILGESVPFCYPSRPAVASGLTERAVALVRSCNELNIMIDLSYLN